jgi:hypothetical protein
MFTELVDIRPTSMTMTGYIIVGTDMITFLLSNNMKVIDTRANFMIANKIKLLAWITFVIKIQRPVDTGTLKRIDIK